MLSCCCPLCLPLSLSLPPFLYASQVLPRPHFGSRAPTYFGCSLAARVLCRQPSERLLFAVPARVRTTAFHEMALGLHAVSLEVSWRCSRVLEVSKQTSERRTALEASHATSCRSDRRTAVRDRHACRCGRMELPWHNGDKEHLEAQKGQHPTWPGGGSTVLILSVL